VGWSDEKVFFVYVFHSSRESHPQEKEPEEPNKNPYLRKELFVTVTKSPAF